MALTFLVTINIFDCYELFGIGVLAILDTDII